MSMSPTLASGYVIMSALQRGTWSISTATLAALANRGNRLMLNQVLQRLTDLLRFSVGWKMPGALVGVLLTFTSLPSIAQEKPPKFRVIVNPDQDCPSRLSIEIEALQPAEIELFAGDVASVEEAVTTEFLRKLDWLLAILERAVPRPSLELTHLGSTEDEDGIAHSVVVTATDGPYLPTADETTTNSLRLALLSFEKYSLPKSLPIRAGILCIDVEPLATELGLQGQGKLTVRAPMRALEELEIPEFQHSRRGAVTLEDAEGFVLAESDFDWPGLVSVASKGKCDLTISLSSRRVLKEKKFKFGPLSPQDAAAGTVIQVRMSSPGGILKRELVVEAKEQNPDERGAEQRQGRRGVLTLTRYTSLLRSLYLPGLQVLQQGTDDSAYHVRLGVKETDQQALKLIQKQAKALNTRRSTDKGGGAVCLLDAAGKERARFDAGSWEISQLERNLSGLEKMETWVVMDVKKAGLGESGAISFDLPESDMRRLYRLLKYSPTASFVARLEKKPPEERHAFVRLPLEGGKTLRVKVELSPALAVKKDDTMVIAGHGLRFTPTVYAFEDTQGVLSALTTRWGALKEAIVPVSAFSVERRPVRVDYPPAAMTHLVGIETGDGFVLAAQDETLTLDLIADRPLSGDCALTLRPFGGEITRDVTFSALDDWELGQIQQARTVDRGKFNIRYKYPVPAPCGAQ
jgi:hypothetical protein